jgi:hypothetical protein
VSEGRVIASRRDDPRKPADALPELDIGLVSPGETRA